MILELERFQELSPQSAQKVLCKCDRCGTEIRVAKFNIMRRKDQTYTFCNQCRRTKRDQWPEIVDALADKIQFSDGCWLWTTGRAGKDQRYGNFRGRTAHRAVYEAVVEPVPKHLQLDHLCKNTLCVNPDHLEPVTARENLMRGDTIGARNAAKTHCVNGHELTPENVYLWRGMRNCRICRKAASRRRHERQRV